MRIWKAIMAALMVFIIAGCTLFLITEMKDSSTDQRAVVEEQKKIKSGNEAADQSSAPLTVQKNRIKGRAQPAVSEKRLDAPYVSQKPELPNGCEVTSLTMLLQFAHVKVDKMTLASQIKKVPFQSGKFKGNPNDGFVGNMYHGRRSNPGLAVYHGPVAELAANYLGARVNDLTGKPWSAVEKQLIAGKPVWTITSINFRPVPDSAWVDWRTREGTMRITFKEHSVLVTGFDKEHVYFNDPLAGRPGSKANKQLFIKAWHQFGNQAISYTDAEE
ncbi:C39 family peptidase [Sporolactobacillus sp. CPB3-1]|uniref:C39 family peptidase n=1 Tax=Sporolactobacillus mangiferae TaxID=2940498 RepID=A0ABT0MA22_9BACL|nr:C39 family peptidase [Sporolactobacillus mangiferae]MCL1631725.1 C39 family peptidase [Sporolactobacillus mangiferae]